MAKLKYPIPVGLEVYARLVDVAQKAGLKTELDWTARGWSLDILREDELLIHCESRKRYPGCLDSLGLSAATKLSKLS